MKVLILDATTSNYNVKIIYANSSDYNETEQDNGTFEGSWLWTSSDGSVGTVSYVFNPLYEEIITVDDSVQISKGDPAPISELLPKIKIRKKQELDLAYNQAIFSDLTDMGTGFTFKIDAYAILNFTMQATDIMFCPEDYPEGTQIYWHTKNQGVQPLTIDQFKGVCKSLRQHLKSNLQKLWTLQNQVDQATTVEEVKAISW